MNDYLNELNPEQLKAVLHKQGALMVIAGPGSGKTRVLTYRIAHLIKQNVNPFNILALTFTNKAAKQMRERIEQIVGYQDVRSIWMGTFHSVFSRILRSESEKINYPKNFTIYDREDCKSLIRSIIKELALDRDIYKISVLQNRISSLKNNFITPENYYENADLVQTDKIAKRTEFGRIFQMYVNRCETASAMDFDDLLLKTYILLNDSPEALHKYQHQFRYILIDEYQDTNYIQYLIIKKLAALNENICIVGDDAQSIYAFRGANIKNILNFKSDYPEYKTYKLEQNYRSTVAIVDTANSLISHNKRQIEKKIWTNNSRGKSIILCKTGSDNDEGRLVANTIFDINLIDQAENSDFAVLYRTNAQSRTIEEALRKKNIPYKIYGGVSFYQRKEIKDLLAYFRLVINPNDEEAFKRIINYPARGIGKTTLLKLSVAANMNQISIWEAIQTLDLKINSGTLTKLREFTLLIDNYRLTSTNRNSYDIAEKIAKDSGIFQHLYNDKSPEGVSRFENIQELLNGIKDFCENAEEGEDGLQHFMQEVALITDVDNEKQEDINKVTLMTVHSAKGLEFNYVFVVGMEENLFPSVISGESQENIEEERRLFYVAITRAKKRLFLSFSNQRFRWGQFIDCEPSRFLYELNDEYIEKKEMSSPKKHNYKPYRIFPNKQKKVKQYPKTPKNLTPLKKLETRTNAGEKFQIGMTVQHNRFGKGKLLDIDGKGSNEKATVFFEKAGQKQLLLKFAKLTIIN